ncbi:unnamed protein product [Chrysodeixis includens]|uniref:Uncharacterized protein n=1 Tax=Chrysodeixis includens TaxID=689277 RepID=A0A9P0BKW4_CHRIL|nr:unnamed protein product [Chrysodeixis includens]
MNIPEIKSYEEQAVDTVVTIINRAKQKLGIRQTLRQLANSRDFACNAKLSLKDIGPPFAITSEQFINNTIEKKWKLGSTFMYIVKYMGGSKDEASQYYYFEMWFRIEGQHVDHDVRFVALTADWILAVIKMKIKLFKRIEEIRLF